LIIILKCFIIGKINKNEVELRKSLQGSSIRGAIIQYGLDNGFESEIEKLLKIKISEVRKFVRKDNKKGNFKTDLNIGIDNQRFGVTLNAGYDTKGKNARGGIGFKVIF